MQVYDSKELFDILCSETFKLVSIKSPNANNITQRHSGNCNFFKCESDLEILQCEIIFRKDTDFYEVSATLELLTSYDDGNVYYVNKIMNIECYTFKDMVQTIFGQKERIKI
jgi:hypothetical protein